MKNKRYPRTVVDLVDYDYEEKLSLKDRVFLEKFTDEFYGASFDAAPLHEEEEQRRELYKVKNHRNSDIYGKGLRGGSVDTEAEPIEERPEWATPPSYLEGSDYKAALSEFRANLPMDGRKNVTQTPKFRSIQRKLNEEAGVSTREGRGAFMAKTKIERLKETREVVMNLGVLVSRCSFPGEDAPKVIAMVNWLTEMLGRVDLKLGSAGLSEEEVAGE